MSCTGSVTPSLFLFGSSGQPYPGSSKTTRQIPSLSATSHWVPFLSPSLNSPSPCGEALNEKLEPPTSSKERPARHPSTLSGRGGNSVLVSPFSRYRFLVTFATIPAKSQDSRIPASILDRYPKNIAANVPRPIYCPDLLEVTGMTGMPHRPQSSDGHLLFHSSSSRFRSRPSSLHPIGLSQKMPVAIARPYRGTLSLGRCGD